MKKEHCEHCKEIVNTMYQYYNGEILNDENESLTLWDYFSDCLDIDYLIGSDKKTVKGVRILVAFGGPNIYVDTMQGKVTLYWWNEYGEAWLPSELCQEIDYMFEEIFYC